MRVWQFFLYHAMIVILSIYLGISNETRLTFNDCKTALKGLLLLDLPSFYLNSVFSNVVYQNDKIIGVTHRMNFFSSYVNPLGLVLTEKWQWMIYLSIRLILAVAIIIMLYLPFRLRKEA